MKSSPLIGLVLLAIGIAVGWYSRGITNGPEQKADAGAEPARATRATTTTPMVVESPSESPPASRGKRAIRESMAESKQGTEDAKATALAESHMRKMMESMATRQRTRLDQHVERLNASLSLTPEQQQKITAWLDENMKKAGEFDVMAASSDPEKAYEAQTAFSPEGLEGYLADMLLPEQKEALEGFQRRDKQGKVDALALKNLSQIQKVVDFSDGQRDQVYQILSEAAERKLADTPKTEQMMSFMHDSMGIETDPYDLGVNTLMQEMMGSPEKMDMDMLKDKKAMAQKLRDELTRRIDEKAALLQAVLSEKQLEQYRTELRTRGGGFLDQMIMGLEMSEGGSDDTIIIRDKDK